MSSRFVAPFLLLTIAAIVPLAALSTEARSA